MDINVKVMILEEIKKCLDNTIFLCITGEDIEAYHNITKAKNLYDVLLVNDFTFLSFDVYAESYCTTKTMDNTTYKTIIHYYNEIAKHLNNYNK